MLKGLILKDLYSVKFQMMMSLVLFLFPNLILLCMTLPYSVIVGEVEEQWFVTLIHAVINFATIVVSSSFLINTVSEDVGCGWCKIAGTMPITVRTVCVGKILSSVMVLSLLTVLSLLVNLFGIFSGVGNTEILIAAPLCSMLLQLTALSPVFPFALRFGARKATPFYLCFLVLFAAVLAASAVICFNFGISEAVRVVFYGGIPSAAAVSVLLSVRFSRKMLVE